MAQRKVSECILSQIARDVPPTLTIGSHTLMTMWTSKSQCAGKCRQYGLPEPELVDEKLFIPPRDWFDNYDKIFDHNYRWSAMVTNIYLGSYNQQFWSRKHRTRTKNEVLALLLLTSRQTSSNLLPHLVKYRRRSTRPTATVGSRTYHDSWQRGLLSLLAQVGNWRKRISLRSYLRGTGNIAPLAWPEPELVDEKASCPSKGIGSIVIKALKIS